ncbi:MAG TPA: hypothetical protein PKC30_01510 [Saprospiraceae bacterium]|nr:hypothetical protein [Saprospiraceae bacterium]
MIHHFVSKVLNGKKTDGFPLFYFMNQWAIYCFVSFVLPTTLFTQGDMVIGEWKSHLPYIRGLSIAETENFITYATDFSLIFLSKEDNSVHFFSKVDGLSDTGIENIYYDPYNKHLVIVYSNSNIDIYAGDGVVNIPDILNSSTIIGSKRILDVHILNGDRMLFSTAFGMVEYRTRRREFGSTIFTNFPVNSVSHLGNYIFAGTDDGLYVVNTDEVTNIADFSRWRLLGEINGLPILYEAKSVHTHKHRIYFSDGKNIYSSDENLMFEKELSVPDPAYNIQYISGDRKYLMAGLRSSTNSRIFYHTAESGWMEGSNVCIDRIRYSIEDQKGIIWFADDFRDFRGVTGIDGQCIRFTYNSPYSEKVRDMDIANGVLITASGGVSDNYQDLFNRDGFSIYKDRKWTNLNEQNFIPFKDNRYLNFFKVTFSPDGKRVQAGTFWNGLFEYDIETGEYWEHNDVNSSLQIAEGDIRVRIADLKYDLIGNLWISNFNAPQPLVVRTKEGEWHSIAVPGERRLGDIATDRNGNKWVITLGAARGILVFHEGSSIQNVGDYRFIQINQNNSLLPSSTIFTLKEDRMGFIWAGTSEGAIVFECFDPFQTDCIRGNRKLIEVDGELGFLLETENVKAIEVDGADRKWFGTDNGIFVMDPAVESQIAHYHIKNSPLFDNSIVALQFDDDNGVMYIATEKGLQAIRTETTAGHSRHSSEVYAFPNPVPPDYNGPIAIKGLARNAQVKITDISGRLIYETQALGGQAIWNGEGLTGKIARPGIFLVFSTGRPEGFDSPDSFVTKIMFSGR